MKLGEFLKSENIKSDIALLTLVKENYDCVEFSKSDIKHHLIDDKYLNMEYMDNNKEGDCLEIWVM